MRFKPFQPVFAILGLGLVAASSGAAQSPATATVVVYRPFKLLGWAANYGIFNDSQELCRLSNRRYVATTVPAGMVTLRSHLMGWNWPRPERVLRFQAQAGQTYFVQTNTSFGISALDMAVVPAEFAKSYLRRITKPDKCSEPYATSQP